MLCERIRLLTLFGAFVCHSFVKTIAPIATSQLLPDYLVFLTSFLPAPAAGEDGAEAVCSEPEASDTDDVLLFSLVLLAFGSTSSWSR